MLRARATRNDRGASAVTIAISMVVIMGIAAVAIDAAGFGFNERRQSQSAADTAVMSGAVGELLNESDDLKVSEVLRIARANLNQTYGDGEWEAIWEGCVDPAKDSLDLGLGAPVRFDPMPKPSAWVGAGDPAPNFTTLDCISQSSSFIRVRIPDQIRDTTFAKVIGFDDLTTSASAVALFNPMSLFDGLIPFGIPASAGNGEQCLSTNPSGIVEPPCQGPTGGGFGAINSEFFGDFHASSPLCGNPGATQLSQNVALGIDHFVDIWSNPDGLSDNQPHPGDVVVSGYTDISYDQCRIVGGTKEHQQAPAQDFPVNAFRVDTGFSQVSAVEAGLISNSLFLGQPSRLQQNNTVPGWPTENIVKRRTGATETIYEVDDRGPWHYLVGSGPCDGSSYDASMPTDMKVQRFDQCLQTGQMDAFSADISDSSRFAWAPQYFHDLTPSGTWYPVKAYRMVFLGGLWFNCTAVPGNCGAVFYPDETIDGPSGEVCDAFGGGCRQLNIDQLSGWILPDDMVPASVRAAFPGGQVSPFDVSLFR